MGITVTCHPDRPSSWRMPGRRLQSQSRPIGLTMLSSLTAPDFTLLLLGIIVCLGGALVWAFWKLEQRLEPLRSLQMAIFRPDED
jgi:hypothetical protein